ncbi:hypothetical protein O181_118987 [Austropuccinia psidii MF-1]|uniref:Uncharacterized protein n=1 Tax=Austropuccinia psidii MF-1 TaxID=1389203 RepID=A0A9Q3KGD5_9BASI|nr:hypothetical protein [Austropuccinia psidii MF-1]
MPIFNEKKKSKKLVFPGPTIQDSEGMYLLLIAIKDSFLCSEIFFSQIFTINTRRRSQYSIQSDGGGLRSRVDPSKGKRKGKIPSGTESSQVSAISKRQVPDMPMISEPELELSMSNSKRDKSHSEGSNRHVYEQVQQYYMVYKDKYWEMLPKIHLRVMKSWHILKRFFKEEEIVKYSNGWNPVSSKPQIKKIKEYHAKKRETSKEEAQVSSTRNPKTNQITQ